MANQAVVVAKLSLILLYLICSYLMGFHGGAGKSPSLFIVSYIIAFVVMFVFWKSNKIKLGLPLLLTVAFGGRLLMLPYPAGDDINRYVWEGEIQNAGFNPFELAPNSYELKHLRNENWKGINHKDIPTIYWPVAQILFRITSAISPSALAFKILAMIFDLGILLLLFFLIKTINGEPKNLILYALNPFTLHWFAGEGHLESVMVFCMVLSLLFYYKKKWAMMFIAISIAILTKLTPFFIIPFIIKKENLKYLPFFFLPFLLFIPYLNGVASPFDVPGLFTSDFTYNGLLNNLLRLIFSKPVTLYISVVIAGISYFLIWLTTSNVLRASFLSLGVFILCTPTFHPWYLLLITPFMIIYSSPAWLALHLTVAAKSFFWIPAVKCPRWHNDPLLLTIEYLPFIIIGMYAVINKKARHPFKYSFVKEISVIIPTLNESEIIPNCLNALKQQKHITQIIISDCGSTDGTVDIAKENCNVTVIKSEKGRGTQIAEALKVVTGDVVVIVHADSNIKDDAFDRMINKLNENLDAAGGAFGAKYSDHRFPMFLPRILNTFRAGILGISFGDQAQFFRKEAIDNFPQFKLMEDIELSMRMKSNGKTLFIPAGVISSSRMWKKSGYFKNFTKVIYLSTLFLIKRRFGILSADCNEFYRAYYGK